MQVNYMDGQHSLNMCMVGFLWAVRAYHFCEDFH